jgi:DNA-binding transcriptional LysR family regulator
MQLSDRIGRRLKLQDLHILMTVVQAGSMRKAATLLNTTQPAVSRSIGELEAAMGVRLLDRSPHGIEPTGYGRALLDGGEAAFDELYQAVKRIEFLADPSAGEVRVGSIAPLAAGFIPEIINRLLRHHPRMVFRVVSAQVETLHRELTERKLDLLIVPRLELFPEELFAFETLYDTSYVVVAGAQNPLVRRRKIELAELANELWVLPPPEHALGPIYSEAFRKSGLAYPHTTVVTMSSEVRMSLLATGRFLTFFHDDALKMSPQHWEIKALPVRLPIAPVANGIVTPTNRTLSPAAQLFIDCARELAKPLAKRK